MAKKTDLVVILSHIASTNTIGCLILFTLLLCILFVCCWPVGGVINRYRLLLPLHVWCSRSAWMKMTLIIIAVIILVLTVSLFLPLPYIFITKVQPRGYQKSYLLLTIHASGWKGRFVALVIQVGMGVSPAKIEQGTYSCWFEQMKSNC